MEPHAPKLKRAHRQTSSHSTPVVHAIKMQCIEHWPLRGLLVRSISLTVWLWIIDKTKISRLSGLSLAHGNETFQDYLWLMDTKRFVKSQDIRQSRMYRWQDIGIADENRTNCLNVIADKLTKYMENLQNHWVDYSSLRLCCVQWVTSSLYLHVFWKFSMKQWAFQYCWNMGCNHPVPGLTFDSVGTCTFDTLYYTG